jgi:protein-S-isoprenylcysteine O-methyltransferase Ste14
LGQASDVSGVYAGSSWLLLYDTLTPITIDVDRTLPFYDRMATYEERDLIRILGEQYLNYQKRVPKWFIRIRRGKGES